MDKLRKPFQGVWNIIRFNWHFYALSMLLIIVILVLKIISDRSIVLLLNMALLVILCPVLVSLVVSCYVYDFSDLYAFSWFKGFINKSDKKIVNIHAGFDETSLLLKDIYKKSEVRIFDFYDPQKHTEVSIKRARKAYPPFPGTQQMSTDYLPLKDNCADKIFVVLSAHEIRKKEERVVFFKELHRVVTENGTIIVTEHLRDRNNFLAYNIGFFHFHSKKTWLLTFHHAGLTVIHEIKISPFITTFILNKNGFTS